MNKTTIRPRAGAYTVEGGALVALVMIVKDEAASIAVTIASAAPVCDFILICDTGSADGTPELAEKAISEGNVSGEVHRGVPFLDFSRARNHALDLLGERAVFSLFLSGDEELRGAPALLSFCSAEAGGTRGAYHLRVFLGAEAVLDSPRLARTASRWRYRYPTHEVLVPPEGKGEGPADQRVPGAVVWHDTRRRTPAGQAARWRRDVDLLRAAPDSDDPRRTFYLAQSYACLASVIQHDPEYRGEGPAPMRLVAKDLYLRRAAMGGWQEEVAEALRRAASCAEAASDEPGGPAENVDLLLRAYSAGPHRGEPLLRLAYRYRNSGHWAAALFFCRAACALPFPEKDVLPVSREPWDSGRWELLAVIGTWVPEAREEGRTAARKAAAARPADLALRQRLEPFYGPLD